MARDVFHPSYAIQVRGVFNGLLLNSSRFNWTLFDTFSEAYSVYLNVSFKADNTSRNHLSSSTVS